MARGPHPLTRNDWPFGSVARRRTLRALLLDEQPENGWSTRSLERKAGVSPRGLHNVLRGAVSWKLIELDAQDRWRLTLPEPSIAQPLRTLLEVVEAAPEAVLPPDLPPRG